MKKINGFSIQSKAIWALVFMLAFFILIMLALVSTSVWFGQVRAREQEDLKMNALKDVVADVYRESDAADRWFSGFLSTNIRFTSVLLREFVTADGYTGPRTFSDGFVAELRGDRVILPEGLPKGQMELSRELIEKSIASGEMLTGRLLVDPEDADALAEIWDGDVGDKTYSDEDIRSCLLSFGEIAGNYVYVDITREIEYLEILDRYTSDFYAALEAANQTFGGVTLAVRGQDGQLEVLRQYGDLDALGGLAGLGIDSALLKQEETVLKANGKSYLCSVAPLDVARSDEQDVFIIQLLPRISLREQAVSRSIVICFMMMGLLATIVVYVIAAQRFSKNNILSEEQVARYSPGRIRRRMVAAGIVSILATFAVAVLIQSVGQLYIEVRYGRDTLQIYSGQLEEADEARYAVIDRQEEEWYVYCCRRLADLLSEYPALAAQKKLQECCGAFANVDFIMLFDAAGKETLCSGDYIGFTLDMGLGANSSDFRRLLLGIPSVVHEPSVDSVTGLERQMIGVRMQDSGQTGKYGALIMAVTPDRQDASVGADGVSEQLSLLADSGTICFAADENSGEILYASDMSMVGRPVTDYGLPEESLHDAYMDFNAIGGVNRFVITERKDDAIYYYAAETGAVFGRVMLYGLICAALFGLMLWCLLAFLMHGYTEKLYADWTAIRLPDGKIGLTLNVPGLKKSSAALSGRLTRMKQKLLDNTQWDKRLPEGKASFVFFLCLLILLLLCGNILLGESMLNHDSLFDFLIHGDWVKGFNLFSLSSVLIILGIAFLINAISRGILQLTGGFLSANGETVCRLLYSCIKYLTAFGVLYFALGYLGFPTTTVVASLGIVSLALSLGAKDLIADILAGIAIVFEGSFQVGDIVEINGNRGTVLELGVRSTKIKVPINNILVINNHNIEDILNLTKETSQQVVNVNVSSRESLAKLEELLNRELPEIGKKCERILIGPYYIGVTALSGSLPTEPTITLSVGAMCEQKHAYSVMLFLNHEIRLLFEREGIDMR